MCVLLFVLHVCMLRECEGDGSAGVGGGDVVVVNAGHVGGTGASGIGSSAADVLGIRVVLFTRLLDIVEYLLPRTSIFQTLLVRVSSKFLII